MTTCSATACFAKLRSGDSMLCDSETVCCVSVMAHCVLARCRVVQSCVSA